ncbi:MAG TPA: L-serine ammonia-lyase, iron-sulfur-dependent, subunit beta, partial [Clostridium sp.]|nr:L-serine ammonia-lyase, iron-sulfur-dependent, subunit beta [Clostridium sp.]
HPNTVKFVIMCEDGRVSEIMGSSIGGGNVIITEVDGDKIEFTGVYPTILINHIDVPGMVAKVSQVLYKYKINIAFMRVYRENVKGAKAAMVFEVDDFVSDDVVNEISKIPNIHKVRAINPISEEE